MQQLSIGAVARITGVPAHTLRKWESRHGIARPDRTDTGRRVYSEAQIEQIKLVKQLVAERHALDTLAGLELEELSSLLAQHDEAVERSSGTVVLVGRTIHTLFTGSTRVLARYADSYRPALGKDLVAAETIVVELDSLAPALFSVLAPLRERYERVLLLYKFAARQTVATLADRGFDCVEGPVSETALKALLNFSESSRAAPAARPSRFEQAELARVAQLSPALACECPNHIAKLLLDVTAFEQYSAGCEDSDPKHQALHNKLASISGQARVLLEDALIAVAVADGLDLKTTDQ